MHVRDQQDKTVEKIEEKDGNVIEERWELQQAWVKQVNFMAVRSRAMKTLETDNGTEMDESVVIINDL